MIAGLITYLLMAALFESWFSPAVTIAAVPLGSIGGLLGLAALKPNPADTQESRGVPPRDIHSPCPPDARHDRSNRASTPPPHKPQPGGQTANSELADGRRLRDRDRVVDRVAPAAEHTVLTRSEPHRDESVLAKVSEPERLWPLT